MFLGSIIFFSGCSEQQLEEFSTEKEGFYNLYFFGNDSEESKRVEEDFLDRWNPEDHPNVNKTSSYNISEKENAPSQLAIDVFELSKENTPVFILFDNKGEVLRTDKFDEVLSYFESKN